MKHFSTKRHLFCLRLLLLTVCPSLLMQACCAGQETTKTDSSKRAAKTTGYSCLFMGHSFFVPMARELKQHPARCGFKDHQQLIVGHGGANGSPGKLWKSKRQDVEKARKLLATGKVDLVGLTFYPDVGSAVTDYRNWIDLALKHNPHTRFFIMSPWARYQGKTLVQYEKDAEQWHGEIHKKIDELRKIYPQTTIFCIPQGRWMVELWRLYDQKKLPEVATLMKPNRQSRKSCLFRDNLGHGGKIPVEAGALLWLAAIYQVDLREYDWDTHTKADLKQLAREIINKDDHADIKNARMR